MEALMSIRTFSKKKKGPSIVEAKIFNDLGCIDVINNDEPHHVHWFRFESVAPCSIFEYVNVYDLGNK